MGILSFDLFKSKRQEEINQKAFESLKSACKKWLDTELGLVQYDTPSPFYPYN